MFVAVLQKLRNAGAYNSRHKPYLQAISSLICRKLSQICRQIIHLGEIVCKYGLCLDLKGPAFRVSAGLFVECQFCHNFLPKLE